MPLTEGPVRRRLLALWLPMIGGVLSVKAIGLADAYFVGQLGEAELAAISFTFPLMMTLISLAIGVGSGASSVVSRAMGGNGGRDAGSAREIVAGAPALTVLVAAVLAAAGLLSAGRLLRWLGADATILADATPFMRIWFAGAVFLLVPVTANGLLRAAGHGTTPAVLMAAAAVLNIALDPLFIFGVGVVPAFDMQGSAIATLTARAVATPAAFAVLHRKALLAVDIRHVRRDLARWREIFRVGFRHRSPRVLPHHRSGKLRRLRSHHRGERGDERARPLRDRPRAQRLPCHAALAPAARPGATMRGRQPARHRG